MFQLREDIEVLTQFLCGVIQVFTFCVKSCVSDSSTNLSVTHIFQSVCMILFVNFFTKKLFTSL